MAEIQLHIDQLVLDTENPRITHSENQREALQKVVKDQKTKLVKLADSIAKYGLSPIDRLMVLKVGDRPRRYIALEGNRRVTAMTLLNNPSAMQNLDLPNGMQRNLEKIAANFKKSNIEPIKCFEIKSREEGRYWIELRHNGEDDGRGVVGWKPIVAARFRNKEPAIQALDVILDHGGISEEEAELIKTNLSLTTFRRLIESPKVQKLIGVTIKDDQLLILIDQSEVLKPLKKMVYDIVNKAKDSRSFNSTKQMTDYVNGFGPDDKPDLTRIASQPPLLGTSAAATVASAAPSKSVKSSTRSRSDSRKAVVPDGCQINVTNTRIAEIYRELRNLKLEDARNAIAVLIRVFLELSIDHFLEANGSSAVVKNGRHETNKKLNKKLEEVVQILIKSGVPRRNFDPILRSLSVVTSPLNIDLLHQYVHNRFATPSPQELTAAWEQSQPLFEKIWP